MLEIQKTDVGLNDKIVSIYLISFLMIKMDFRF